MTLYFHILTQGIKRSTVKRQTFRGIRGVKGPYCATTLHDTLDEGAEFDRYCLIEHLFDERLPRIGLYSYSSFFMTILKSAGRAVVSSCRQ